MKKIELVRIWESVLIPELDGFTKKQIGNIQKIVNGGIPVKELTHYYSSAEDCWNILFLVDDGSALIFHSNDAISFSKNRNDCEYEPSFCKTDINIKKDFANHTTITEAIKTKQV